MDSEVYEVFLDLSLFFFGNLENDLCTLENGCGKVKLSYLEDTCICLLYTSDAADEL